jgi:hypothetical protein
MMRARPRDGIKNKGKVTPHDYVITYGMAGRFPSLGSLQGGRDCNGNPDL